MFSPQFQALNREAGIAASAIAHGITSISKANYAAKDYYLAAFFNLSIAIERLGKLSFVLDHLLTNNAYPTDAQLRVLGHRLVDLVAVVEEIRVRRGLKRAVPLPTDPIRLGIVAVLSDFATATRYYNLDLLVGGRAARMQEPIAAWHARVGVPILVAHYSNRQRGKDETQAQVMGALLGDVTYVLHTAEDGSMITSFTAASTASGQIKTLQRYGRMYSLGIIRFLSLAMTELGHQAQLAGHEVPSFSDSFGMFGNDDAYFLRRKTWDPYRP